MGVGDVRAVPGCTDLHYVDTGMFGTAEYGSVYVLTDPVPAVVDTGTGADRERIDDALAALGIERAALEAILLTHVHLDHAGGAGYLADACPNATVYVHEAGEPHLVDPDRLIEGTKRAVGDAWRHYAEPRPVPADRVASLSDGDEVALGDRTLVAHRMPGHAPHQVAFHDRRDDALFAGDAAGIWLPSLDRVRETSPPPQFDLEACLADVERLCALDPAHLLYAHFGPGPDDVTGALTGFADALTDWVAAVAAADATLDGNRADRVETLVERLAPAGDVVDVWGAEKARAETAINVRGVLTYLDRAEGA
ncbi:MAG: MBL fold metallo-hydrolase [Halobacteriaceae archaeon]